MLELTLTWFIANFVPHLVVLLAAGKSYYQLRPLAGIAVESSIMLLNLLLPFAVLRFRRKHADTAAKLGWTWNGWRAVLIGLAGLAALFVISVASQRLLGNPVGLPPRPLTRLDVALAAAMMLVLNVAAEETMFRGYLQTDLTRRYGAWIGIGLTTLLFGLSHLPMDIYGAMATQASGMAWFARMFQLYSSGLILSLIRHWGRSNWASWISHEGLMLLVIVITVLPRLI